jgi:hypothetical protein
MVGEARKPQRRRRDDTGTFIDDDDDDDDEMDPRRASDETTRRGMQVQLFARLFRVLNRDAVRAERERERDCSDCRERSV